MSLCRRIAGSPFSTVDPVWRGDTCCIIGGGPSVTAEQVGLTRSGCKVIAINDAYVLAPWADVCYFADARWWQWHKGRPAFQRFAGERVTIDSTASMKVCDAAVHVLGNGGPYGLSEDPGALRTGTHSGYQALNLAILTGARRVLLLGYDCRFQGRRSHWFGSHPSQDPEAVYRRYARAFDSMLSVLKRLSVEVINCTPGSAITAFPRGDIKEYLPELTAGDRAPIAAQS